MAVAGFLTPFAGSITATTGAQSLYTLLNAVFTNLPHKCCYLQIQLNTDAGGTILYIGNSNVSSTICGAALFAGQANQQLGFDSNLIVLDHIYLLASTGTAQVNVIVVVR